MAEPAPLRHYCYVSESRIGDDAAALAAIVAVSQANNAAVGLTGLLWSDGWHFAQVLEGEAGAIDATMARIRLDRRHQAVHTVIDGWAETRQFGDWAMIGPAAEALARPCERRMTRLLTRTPGPLARLFAAVIAGPTRLDARTL